MSSTNTTPLPDATPRDRRRWASYHADERAEARVYRELAARKSWEERDILTALADAEGRHEAHWLELLGGDRVRVEICEGKYHQIKRMLGSRQLPVRELHRERIGGLTLDESLAPGEYRLLSRAELERIAPGILSK